MQTRSILFVAALGLVPWAGASAARDFQLPLHGSGQAVEVEVEAAPSYRADLLSLHKHLVSIPSISGDEEAVGNFLIDHLTERGYHAQRQSVAPSQDTPRGKDRFNVIAWKGDKAADPKVVVSSHIDVVPPFIPYGIDEGKVTRDTMIKGRGSVDAKGSVAAMVTALNELHAHGQISNSHDVMLVFVVGEEVGGEGMRTFSKALSEMESPPHFDAVIFGEPTESKLVCGHKGSLFCNVVAKGIPGHSGYPWLGKSANELMIRAMAAILDADLGSSDLFGNTTFNVGRMDGGVASNVIAERATVAFLARVAIGPEASGHFAVKQKVQAILDDIDKEAFEMDCREGYGSIEMNCAVQGFQKTTVNYGTDIHYLTGNHTRYLYGPGSIFVAHGARENLTVANLEDAVEGYKKLILHALEQS